MVRMADIPRIKLIRTKGSTRFDPNLAAKEQRRAARSIDITRLYIRGTSLMIDDDRIRKRRTSDYGYDDYRCIIK